MGTWMSRLGPMTLDLSVEGLIWLGIITLALVGSRQPVRRCCLARVGVLGALVLIPLGWLPPRTWLEIPIPLRVVSAPAPELGSAPLGPAPILKPTGIAFSRCLMMHWLVLIHLVGIAAGLVWLTLIGWGTAWMNRRSGPPALANEDLYRSLPYKGGRRRPRLRVGARLDRPVLLGILRPTIFIPPELNLPEARDQLRLGLLHELAHARRLDPLFNLLGGLAQAVWFYLPPIWWIRYQMRLDQEFLADFHASRSFDEPNQYASSLVELAADPTSDPIQPSQPEPSQPSRARSKGSMLFRRVLMLVQCPFPIEPRPPIWWRCLIPTIALVGLVLVSSVTLRDLKSPQPGRTILQLSQIEVGGSNEQDPDDPPYCPILGLRLPDHFELTVEVLANPDELAQTRVLGYSLALTDAPVQDQTQQETWHSFRLSHQPQGDHLWLDGRPILTGAQAHSTFPQLTLQPAPHHPGEFRNLTLRW